MVSLQVRSVYRNLSLVNHVAVPEFTSLLATLQEVGDTLTIQVNENHTA